MRRRVPVSELVDLEALGAPERAPHPARIREALPRGWVLEPDGAHARRDARLLFREGWILLVGLAVFGALGGLFVLDAMPRGWRGALRLAVLLAVVLAVGGVVGPLVTRALRRR